MKMVPRTEIDVKEEKRANTLFIFLFYLTFILFDTYRFGIRPILNPDSEPIIFSSLSMMITYIVIYIITAALFPLSIYLSKKKKPFIVKYLYFFVFLAGALTTEMVEYFGTNNVYASGSPVELVFVLFSPIFVNRMYYFVIVLGLVCKYAFMGIFTFSPEVAFPIMLLLLFSAVTFIILNRFISYLKAVEKSYEHSSHNEKLAFIGRIATGVTHEIKNPLTSLKGFVQLQEDEQTYNQKHSKIMLQELDRLTIIVNDLMILGKPQAINLKSIDLYECVRYVVDLFQQEAENKQITIYTHFEEQGQVLGDAGRIKQVLLNILKNAIEAMPSGGEVRIKLVKDKEWTTVQIIDRGIGIPEKDIPNLEKAFYSTKENGTGLGLMVSYKIIEEHKGKIRIDSEVGVGTTFSLCFPTPN
ncbi:ATP-binding protein [Guptibacillus hwajinpoensis]|uniref:histidine kinase n=1 Tax=Guptibacillus hwajinpoensis TaxID=208199 RepID=A0ABU0K4H6_9BACL|nr:ATP-binding protein [Alkalihalobacillus hemicentroti]MDQ0484251.1 signal transduction histidine kinase [Alkalihalobacillus hemicentroti]